MNKLFALSLVVIALLLPICVNAQEAQPTPSAEVAVESQPVEVGNKLCPVSGEAVGTAGMEPQKVTYKGKVYNLCCAMCAMDFNKDPEKYIQIINEEMNSETQIKA